MSQTVKGSDERDMEITYSYVTRDCGLFASNFWLSISHARAGKKDEI